MNSAALNIQTTSLIFGYLLLIIPISILLIYRIKLMKDLTISLLRLTLQLLLVGLYLQFLFKLNAWWLNVLWLFFMIVAADISLLSASKLSLRRFLFPIFLSLLAGTLVPLFYMVGIIIRLPNLLEAQYFIPIAGMIMGNSLRADIVGLSQFYNSIQSDENGYLLSLAQGATLNESVRPYLKRAFSASLAPTLATMATIGIVSLPGMMTGIILGGTDPVVAIKYQIAIMIAIFTGTTITVILGIILTIKTSFSKHGVLDPSVFKK
ncbi:ABC transporter permease [Acidobacteriota bacterium]